MIFAQKKAFSLIELLVVIVIFMILCSISIPLFFNRTKNQLRYEIDKLETMLTYLQQSAMARGQKITVLFDLKKNSYSFTTGNKRSDIQLSPNIKFGYLNGCLGPPSNPKKRITTPISFHTKSAQATLKIQPNGQSTAGTIYFTDKDKKLMGALTCGVSQVSYIRKYTYRRHMWQLLDD